MLQGQKWCVPVEDRQLTTMRILVYGGLHALSLPGAGAGVNAIEIHSTNHSPTLRGGTLSLHALVHDIVLVGT